MPLFVLTCTDKPDGFDLRAATREAHLAYLVGQGERVKIAGPFLDAEGRPTGSLLVIDVADRTAAIAFAEADPYAKAGLFSHFDARPWRLGVGGFGPPPAP